MLKLLIVVRYGWDDSLIYMHMLPAPVISFQSPGYSTFTLRIRMLKILITSDSQKDNVGSIDFINHYRSGVHLVYLPDDPCISFSHCDTQHCKLRLRMLMFHKVADSNSRRPLKVIGKGLLFFFFFFFRWERQYICGYSQYIKSG